MKLLGLDLPTPTHKDALLAVGGALAVVLGFGIGSTLTGHPMDRGGAIALFLGCLYAFAIHPLLNGRDARARRYGLAASGAAALIGFAAVLEHFAIL